MEVELVFELGLEDLTTGPPIGPALAPYGVDINKVVEEMRKLLLNYKGIKVKIGVKIDVVKRSFRVYLKRPKTTELIKKYSKDGKITEMQLDWIAKVCNVSKKHLYGTCKSMGIEVVGAKP